MTKMINLYVGYRLSVFSARFGNLSVEDFSFCFFLRCDQTLLYNEGVLFSSYLPKYYRVCEYKIALLYLIKTKHTIYNNQLLS